jgi:hypothetical protein
MSFMFAILLPVINTPQTDRSRENLKPQRRKSQMALGLIRRVIAAAIWGPPRLVGGVDAPPLPGYRKTGEGGSAPSPADLNAVRIYVDDGDYLETDADTLGGLLKRGLIVRSYRDRPAGEPDGGVGVADQPGELAAVDHDVAAGAAIAPGLAVGGDDLGGLRLEAGDFADRIAGEDLG